MKYKVWTELFPPQIRMRGLDYFRNGYVGMIHFDGRSFSAEVEGSECYDVSVELNPANHRITNHSCSCPYAEDGTPCKHLAALLYALEEDEPSAEAETANHSAAQLVNQLSVEQLQRLLIEFAEKDSYIMERLTLAANRTLPHSQTEQWQAELDELADNLADRHGYISYEDAYDYCFALLEYVTDRTPALLASHMVKEAFELVCLVFETGIEQDMDDSDGGLTVLANGCMEEWTQIIPLASEDEQKSMLRWFLDLCRKETLSGEFAGQFLFDIPWDDALAPQLLDAIDQRIKACVSSHTDHYLLNELIPLKIRWMKQAGISESKQKAFLKANRRLPVVRRMMVNQAEAAGDYKTAIALLKESKQLDSDHLGLAADAAKRLIQIYEAICDRSALLSELEEYLFTFSQDNLTYVNKLKATLPADQWAKQRDKLLQSKTMQFQTYPLLFQEQMYEQMMERIEKTTSIYALEQYESTLKKLFPQRCISVYRTHLLQAMAQASQRKAYYSVIQTLKRLKSYPDGKAVACSIAEHWKQTYPRRSSMLDELRKAGF